METLSKTANNGIGEISPAHITDLLREINVSAFLDNWGPEHVLQVYDPDINMRGVLVIDNMALGPACGGLSISPRATPHDVFQHARRATWCCALANTNFGGAAAGIRADPLGSDKKALIRSFAKEISPYVPRQYIAAPDAGIGQLDMASFVEEIGDRSGATGKPEKMGGIPYELGVVGLGMGVSIEAFLETARSFTKELPEISGASVAIQGFDGIGRTAAKYLASRGASIIAISDGGSVFHDPKGLDAAKMAKCVEAGASAKPLKHCRAAKAHPHDNIEKIECDVFISASEEGALSEDTARTIKAKCVVEGGGMLSPSAEQALQKRGITILPDILVLAGGPISSYSEYNHENRTTAFSLIEARSRETTKKVVERSLELSVPIRRVAKEIAKERITEKMEERA